MVIQGVEMLTLIGGLCFTNPIGVVAGAPGHRLAAFLLRPPEDGDRIQSSKRRVLSKTRDGG
jgi:hypothetical protein